MQGGYSVSGSIPLSNPGSIRVSAEAMRHLPGMHSVDLASFRSQSRGVRRYTDEGGVLTKLSDGSAPSAASRSTGIR